MPDFTITLSEDDTALLERVRRHFAMATLDEAAEWLVKARLRRVARMSNGRGRALYPVPAITGGAA